MKLLTDVSPESQIEGFRQILRTKKDDRWVLSTKRFFSISLEARYNILNLLYSYLNQSFSSLNFQKIKIIIE
jgi:hypothetical protein